VHPLHTESKIKRYLRSLKNMMRLRKSEHKLSAKPPKERTKPKKPKSTPKKTKKSTEELQIKEKSVGRDVSLMGATSLQVISGISSF